MALRAVDILEKEVYRFSVDNVTRIASSSGSVRMAFISSQSLPAGSVQPADFVFHGKTCRKWNAVDDLAKPAEFHPRYMRCLVKYGRSRGRVLAWNRAG